MGFPDDKEKEEKENINGAECERKQGNDEGRHCKNTFKELNISNIHRYLSYKICMHAGYSEAKSNTELLTARVPNRPIDLQPILCFTNLFKTKITKHFLHIICNMRDLWSKE